MRRPDCKRYPDCLTAAAKVDWKDISCQTCKNYIKRIDITEIDMFDACGATKSREESAMSDRNIEGGGHG